MNCQELQEVQASSRFCAAGSWTKSARSLRIGQLNEQKDCLVLPSSSTQNRQLPKVCTSRQRPPAGSRPAPSPPHLLALLLTSLGNICVMTSVPHLIWRGSKDPRVLAMYRPDSSRRWGPRRPSPRLPPPPAVRRLGRACRGRRQGWTERWWELLDRMLG